RIEGVEGQLADEEVLREGIVKETPTGAHNRLTLAGHVVSKTDARRKIVPIIIVELIESVCADEDKSACAIKIAQQIVLFFDDTKEVVTQARVQSEPATRAPAILKVGGVRVLRRAALRVAACGATAR